MSLLGAGTLKRHSDNDTRISSSAVFEVWINICPDVVHMIILVARPDL